MSLDYTISNRNDTGGRNAIPDINTPEKWRTGWYRELLKRIEDKNDDLTAQQIDAQITDPAEKYAYEHDIANYGWVTNKDGTRSYEAGMGNRFRSGGARYNYGAIRNDPEAQKLYQQELQGQNTATQGRTGYQQASQSVFDTSSGCPQPND